MGALAEEAGGAAKTTSGAGGGDCGIVIIDRAIDTTSLFEKWRDNPNRTVKPCRSPYGMS